MMRHRTLRHVLALVLVVLVALPAAAQNQIVLLHGYRSEGRAWDATAERLRTQFDVRVDHPSVKWDETFSDQVASLERQAVLATPTPVFVGHSNGGLAARTWSRQTTPDTVVTIGTPHWGAPMIPQFWNWYVFQRSGVGLIGDLQAGFSGLPEWSWVFAQISGSLNWLGAFGNWTVAYLAASFGIAQARPVSNEMRPGSDTIRLLNGPANLERERSAIRARVGIVSVAHNFYWAGPMRGILPEIADGTAVLMYGIAGGLGAWAAYLYATGDPTDLDVHIVADRLFGLAGFVVSIDPIYCAMISSVSGTVCLPNDGVVPYLTQEYPGAPNVYLGFENNDGPAHVQEMDEAGVITDVLRQYSALPGRDPNPPPPPPPAPPAPGPTEPVPTRDRLSADELLHVGDRLVSGDGRFELGYQSDGNLLLATVDGGTLWASGSQGTDPGMVVMQEDGNLVVYTAAGVAVWASGTHGHPGAYLMLQDDGNLVIYAADGSPLWASATVQP